MPTRSFSISPTQSQQFAKLSGDWNPVHIDPLIGRRTLFGGTVVHGMHATLLAIDLFLADASERRSLASIQVSYTSGLSQEQKASMESLSDGETSATLRILSSGQIIQIVKLTWSKERPLDSSQQSNACPPREIPDVINLEAAANLNGEVTAQVDESLASGLFPSLTKYLPLNQIAAMLAATRIVGMRCPGLHSIFSAIKLSFEAGANSDVVSYSIQRHSVAANFVTLALEGSGAVGEINAFFRPAPTEQPEYADLKGLIPQDKFSHRCALVIGGSRGLGEITAKLLAAGGAQVILTWHSGEQDATDIVQDIVSGGGQASAIHWDCSAPPGELPAYLAQTSPTHVYYFATPRIELNRTGTFNQELFENYIDIYVTGMERSLRAAQQLWDPSKIECLFLPSTIFLDEPDAATAEYTKAKAMAETAARGLAARTTPRIDVRAPRLPKVLTDQTNSLTTSEIQSGTDVLLSELV